MDDVNIHQHELDSLLEEKNAIHEIQFMGASTSSYAAFVISMKGDVENVDGDDVAAERDDEGGL